MQSFSQTAARLNTAHGPWFCQRGRVQNDCLSELQVYQYGWRFVLQRMRSTIDRRGYAHDAAYSYRSNRKKRRAKPFPLHKPAPPSQSNNWVTLHLMDTGQVLPWRPKRIYAGRISEGQPIMPDIDLSPIRPMQTVFQIACCDQRMGNRVFMMDLGSANGTISMAKD